MASEIFSYDYAYFSSYSTSWLDHARSYVDMITERFGYNKQSQVMELASNDGYLLQYFQKKNIPVLGIEPAKDVAQIAQNKGIETIIDFFGVRLAKQLTAQDREMDLLDKDGTKSRFLTERKKYGNVDYDLSEKVKEMEMAFNEKYEVMEDEDGYDVRPVNKF